MLPSASADLYDAQRRRSAAASIAARRAWSGIGDDFDAGWPRVLRRLLAIVISAQSGAAQDAASSVSRALAQQGMDVEPDGAISAGAFSGYASDGRGLDTLLYGTVVNARTAQANSLQQRVSAGARFLDRAVQMQVADASRQAAGVAVASRQGVGWVRMVNPPCCKRCAPLAGRVYRYSQGFQRHPHCDCTMIPTSIAHPRARGTIIGPDDVSDLSRAERAAIDDGADFNRVINAGRGRDGLTTLEMAPQGAKRLTPEGIYRIASDRDEAVRLLRRHGYLI